MDVKVLKVKQYNSTYKRILMIDDNPVCIVASDKRASECIQYLSGYNADINDRKIKKVLDKYRMPLINKDTERMKKRKKRRFINLMKTLLKSRISLGKKEGFYEENL